MVTLLMAVNLSSAPLPPDQTLYDAAFGGGTFVAVGAKGTISSSVSGGAWQSRNSGTTNRLGAVAYGGGIFVAAGENGTLLSSPDGVSWELHSVDASIISPRIAYGNGRFVVGGDGPTGFWTLLISANGVAWTVTKVEASGPSSSGGRLPFGGVSFGKGEFLAVGGLYGANLFLHSVDGLTWQEQGTSGMPTAIWAKGPVTQANGQFALVTNYVVQNDDDDDDGGPLYVDSVYTSGDGVSWQGTSLGTYGGGGELWRRSIAGSQSLFNPPRSHPCTFQQVARTCSTLRCRPVSSLTGSRRETAPWWRWEVTSYL